MYSVNIKIVLPRMTWSFIVGENGNGNLGQQHHIKAGCLLLRTVYVIATVVVQMAVKPTSRERILRGG